MHAVALSSAASTPKGDEEIETLGLSGTTLMQLWSIGVARVSDLTTYNTKALRAKLAESLDGSADARERIEKTLADIHSVLRKSNVDLPSATEEGSKETSVAEEDKEVRLRKLGRELETPDHESLDKINEGVPRLFQDPMQQFYQDMKRYNRLLSREEQNELGRRIQEEKDIRARDTLVLHNLRLVLWTARKYLWSKLELADLVQEGIIGLMIAADKYDYKLGFAFSTYAHWWVRQALTRAIMDSGFIRVPVHMGETILKVRRAMVEIATREGRPPTLAEVATAIEGSPKDVKHALKVMRMSVVSLDEKADTTGSDGGDGEGNELYNLIADETALRADHLLEARQELDQACERLNYLTETLYEDETISERNREVFVRFYGLDGSLKRRTMDHVAERFGGIGRERVRQILVAVWEKLQRTGLDMDHGSVVEELARIAALEKLAHKRVSAD